MSSSKDKLRFTIKDFGGDGFERVIDVGCGMFAFGKLPSFAIHQLQSECLAMSFHRALSHGLKAGQDWLAKHNYPCVEPMEVSDCIKAASGEIPRGWLLCRLELDENLEKIA